MPHGFGVDNCRLRFCRNGRQLDLGERRSPTQIFRCILLHVSDRFLAYVYTFGADGDDGDGDDGDDGDGDNDGDDDGVGDGNHRTRRI